MASLNLSANGPSISKSYQSVVDSSISELAKSSSTFAKWALFSVSTPLMSAFQQDAGNKESVLKVQDTGEGELADLLDEFSEGKIQFSFVKVLDANTGLPKNVLIAWCGEGVPERTKGYFTSHLSTVSKVLHGYHVQVTARSDTDLTVEGIIQKVSDASGAKYTPGPERSTSSISKPPVSNKPAFTPLRTGGVSAATAGVVPLPIRAQPNNDDGWGPDAPPVTRTNLEKVQPAYQPTRVNMQELRSGKQPDPTIDSGDATHQQNDIVKGGYQPIGKVDIAAIRRQAREDGNLKDDRPEPVKGAYEPVGKVDIAAIRARAQPTGEATTTASGSTSPSAFDGPPTAAPDLGFNQSSRLTSLPKPKVSNKFGGSSTFTGTKPPLPGGGASGATPTPVGSASRTFANQGGKTPAQLWAERKAKEREQEPAAATAACNTGAPTIQTHTSGGGEWKSSYSGKTWAPVQTTHTGKVAESSRNEATGSDSADMATPEPTTPQKSVSSIRDQLTQGPPKEAPRSVQTAESDSEAEVGGGDTELAASSEPQASQPLTSQPQLPPSPTTDLSGEESSPIRVAVPVARGATDDHEQPIPAPVDAPTESLQQGLPHDKDETDNARDTSLTTTQATSAGTVDSGEIRAVVQYDYEKAEDNEVDLKEGEYVTEIDMVDKDWWLGLNARGERGLFPSNYVEVIGEDHGSRAEYEMQPTADSHEPNTVAVPTQTPRTQEKFNAKALYDYEAAEDNELSFPEGAEITSIEFPDDDWWLGEYRGKTGLFPANYVQLDD
ncbi:putative actin binding protein [Aspergillus undulatus]|uniref:putative actin binding protein n=1 Tax=Aspergillus undulatus TaxID=1810928 RepID=UPI003CCDCF78